MHVNTCTAERSLGFSFHSWSSGYWGLIHLHRNLASSLLCIGRAQMVHFMALRVSRPVTRSSKYTFSYTPDTYTHMYSQTVTRTQWKCVFGLIPCNLTLRMETCNQRKRKERPDLMKRSPSDGHTAKQMQTGQMRERESNFDQMRTRNSFNVCISCFFFLTHLLTLPPLLSLFLNPFLQAGHTHLFLFPKTHIQYKHTQFNSSSWASGG